MVCPNKYNKVAKRDEKIGKYHRLCCELRERREDSMVKEISTIIGCLGGGIKKLKSCISQISENDNNDKELESISREMEKTVLWESKSLIRKALLDIRTDGMRYFNLTNKFWKLKSPPIPFFSKFKVY